MYISHHTLSINGIAHPSGMIFHIFVYKLNTGPDQTHDLMIPCWNIVQQNCALEHNTLSVDFYSHKSHLIDVTFTVVMIFANPKQHKTQHIVAYSQTKVHTNKIFQHSDGWLKLC